MCATGGRRGGCGQQEGKWREGRPQGRVTLKVTAGHRRQDALWLPRGAHTDCHSGQRQALGHKGAEVKAHRAARTMERNRHL